jgi:hypothetical protein
VGNARREPYTAMLCSHCRISDAASGGNIDSEAYVAALSG